MAGKIAWFVLRWAVGGLFIWAGALKAADAPGFASDVGNYHFVPAFAWDVGGLHFVSTDLIVVVAVVLPWLEIVAGAALLVRRKTLGALALLAGLTLLFLAALGSAWWRGLDITCGCFGKETIVANFPWLIGRDVALLAAIVALFWQEVRERTRRPADAPL